MWHTYKNHTFYVDDTPTINWGDAQKVCQNVGGDLAIIKSLDENDVIRELFLKQNTVTQLGAWIGLFRKGNHDPYNSINLRKNDHLPDNSAGLSWVDGTGYAIMPSFFPWGSSQPDNYGMAENCVHVNPNGRWNDLSCNANGDVLNAPVILCQKSEHMLLYFIVSFTELYKRHFLFYS